MNKREAEDQFRNTILPRVCEQYESNGEVDWSARAEAWNNWTDYLHKQHYITAEQYSSWTHPRCTAGPRR